jgi:parallel beta-helix repeat protein
MRILLLVKRRPRVATVIPLVKASAIVIVVVVIVAASVVLWIDSEDEENTSHQREGITLMSESDLTEANGVKSGDGTEVSPYLIEGWEVGYVRIQNIESHLIVRNLSISSDTAVWKTDREEFPMGGAGIHILDSSNVTVERCTIVNKSFGIIVDGGNTIFARSNIILSCHRGIASGYEGDHSAVTNLEIVENEFRDGWTAVQIWSGIGVLLKSNDITGFDYGVSLGMSVGYISLEDNILEYIDAACVSAISSSYVSVSNNTMNHVNGTGVWFWWCGWSNVTSNSIMSCQYGIRIDGSHNINISKNVLLDGYADYYGHSYGPACTELAVTESSNINFTENRVFTNYIGVEVLSSSSFVAHHNAIVHSSFHINYGYVLAVDDGGSRNKWDDGIGEGNYWGPFSYLVDTDSDGIYDGPLVIDTDSQDNYPLVNEPVFTS